MFNLSAKVVFTIFALILGACGAPPTSETELSTIDSDQYITILGTSQDAGYPQAGCKKACCNLFWTGKTERKYPVALGLTDVPSGEKYLFEATPAIKFQLEALSEKNSTQTFVPDGIFLTHAHVGHYTGLTDLGREVMGTKGVPVYAMPRMKSFLETNGPWSQLVKLDNIELRQLTNNESVELENDTKVTPFRVPHRDEFSETVGYRIEGKNRKVLFIPDIDKWSKWERDIIDEISKVDVALLDGTFLKNGELPNRDMSQIPHPFVEESMALFKDLPESEKEKVTFIHFNHTNPLIWDKSEIERVEKAGFRVAKRGQIIEL